MIQLIVFRAIQGIGGGGVLTLAMIIISDVVSLKERGKYQGITGVVVVLSNSIGPIIGGLLTEKASWRWCFVSHHIAPFLHEVPVLTLCPVHQSTHDCSFDCPGLFPSPPPSRERIGDEEDPSGRFPRVGPHTRMGSPSPPGLIMGWKPIRLVITRRPCSVDHRSRTTRCLYLHRNQVHPTPAYPILYPQGQDGISLHAHDTRQWLCVLCDTVLPTYVLPGRSGRIGHSIWCTITTARHCPDCLCVHRWSTGIKNRGLLVRHIHHKNRS